MKQCIIEGCENECEPKRRYCRSHYLERKREQARVRHQLGLRTKYDIVCDICGRTIKACNKTQRFCMSCYREVQRCSDFKPNGYSNAKGGNYCWLHRRLAEGKLHRVLNSNEVVHHLDGNQVNNDERNLIVMSRSDHTSLHSYLKVQRALLLKNSKENFENCWKNLIVPITTAWLETTGANVIRIWEIGQSASEPLSNGEGSETMHEATNHESVC